MAVLVPGKLLFLATPRTASHAIQDALRRLPGARSYGHHVERHRIADHDGEPAFALVRNPYDVLASWWARAGGACDGDFARYVREYENQDFVRNGRLFYHAVPGVEMIRWEDLPASLDDVLRRAGLPPQPLRRLNPTGKKLPWRTYYGPAEVEAANERFGHEIDRFGYERLPGV